MLYATHIKMKSGRENSQNLTEIDQIFLRGFGWYPKDILHDHLLVHPKTIAVNIFPYPCLIPAISSNKEKYVRSNPNDYEHDNLLDLPRV